MQFLLVGAYSAAYYLKIGAAYLIAGMFHDRCKSCEFSFIYCFPQLKLELVDMQDMHLHN